jgi:hypothetical protein
MSCPRLILHPPGGDPPPTTTDTRPRPLIPSRRPAGRRRAGSPKHTIQPNPTQPNPTHSNPIQSNPIQINSIEFHSAQSLPGRTFPSPLTQRRNGQQPGGPAAQLPDGPAVYRSTGPAAQRPGGPAAQRPIGPTAHAPRAHSLWNTAPPHAAVARTDPRRGFSSIIHHASSIVHGPIRNEDQSPTLRAQTRRPGCRPPPSADQLPNGLESAQMMGIPPKMHTRASVCCLDLDLDPTRARHAAHPFQIACGTPWGKSSVYVASRVLHLPYIHLLPSLAKYSR